MSNPQPEPDRTKPTNSMNANQFDDDGLPGIDAEFPPDRSWAVDDPALVNGGSETQDDLRTRLSREVSEDPARVPSHTAPLISHNGDPQSSPVDDEKQAVARTGRADPDAPVSAEEAAMHVIEPD